MKVPTSLALRAGIALVVLAAASAFAPVGNSKAASSHHYFMPTYANACQANPSQANCDGQSSGLCNSDQQSISSDTNVDYTIQTTLYYSPTCHSYWGYTVRQVSNPAYISAGVTTSDNRHQGTNLHNQGTIASTMLYCPSGQGVYAFGESSNSTNYGDGNFHEADAPPPAGTYHSC